jgi:phytanoyl-CoA hydroxylase
MKSAAERFSFDSPVEPHAPELYDYVTIAQGVKGFDAVDSDQIASFEREGFLAIHEAFSPAEVKAARQGIEDLVAGKYPEFDGLQFTGRVMETFSTLSLDEKLDAIRKLYSFTEFEPHLKGLAEHPTLKAIIRTLIRAEPELYQSMALLKPPQGREKPWHQDHSHFDLPLSARVVGVWIALDRATPENGCMRVLPGWHRKGALGHEQRRDFQISDTQMMELKRESVAVPLDAGGCVLFDSFLPHGTPINLTGQRRWAVQFHFLPVNTPRITPEERLAVFAPGSAGL